MTTISQLFPSSLISQRQEVKPESKPETQKTTNTQKVASTDIEELKNTASAASTSFYFFNEKLGVLLGELRRSKENLIKSGAQKEFINQAEEFIKIVESFMLTIGKYEIRLSEMYHSLAKEDSSKSIKPSKVAGASSDAIKMSQNLFEKLEAFGIALGNKKGQFKTFYNEVQVMKADIKRMQGGLSVIYRVYSTWSTDEIKGITSGKAIKSGDEVLITDLNKILTSSKMIKSDLRWLASAIGQFGEENEISVKTAADVKIVNLLIANMELFEKGIENVYKEFGTLRPPIDIIGSKVVYDKSGSILNIIEGIEKKNENLNIQLKNLAFTLGVKYNQSQPNEKGKYLTAIKLIEFLSGYPANFKEILNEVKKSYTSRQIEPLLRQMPENVPEF